MGKHILYHSFISLFPLFIFPLPLTLFSFSYLVPRQSGHRCYQSGNRWLCLHCPNNWEKSKLVAGLDGSLALFGSRKYSLRGLSFPVSDSFRGADLSKTTFIPCFWLLNCWSRQYQSPRPLWSSHVFSWNNLVYRDRGIYWVKGSMPVLLWNLYHWEEGGEKGGSINFKTKHTARLLGTQILWPKKYFNPCNKMCYVICDIRKCSMNGSRQVLERIKKSSHHKKEKKLWWLLYFILSSACQSHHAAFAAITYHIAYA